MDRLVDWEYIIWLVVTGTMEFQDDFPIILGMFVIIPTDELTP
jgi:hypothetical protein